MELTKKQKIGLEIAVNRYNEHEPYTCIAGYAGTGKSTLIKFIISALNLDEYDVAYVSYTGKAAEVLRSKGCPNATTAHKLLYYSNKLANGKFVFKPRKRLERRYRLIVCDEVSMLPKPIWDLLLSHRIHIICTGDPFQLPPIYKDADNHVLDEPHIFLDEVMRQAADSEIIQLSMKIRNGEHIKYYKGKEVQVIPKEDVVSGMYTWADQILVATNKKRESVNNYVRQLLGRGPEPEKGDKVISLSNHWDFMDLAQTDSLINGTIGYIINTTRTKVKYKLLNKTVDLINTDITTSEDLYDGNIYQNIPIDYSYLTSNVSSITPKQEYKLYKNKDPIPFPFSYGYAITGHKAQGSEWDKVLIFEEGFPYDAEEHARWLYTAVTRGAKKVVLVR